MSTLPSFPFTPIDSVRVAVDAPVSTDLMTDISVDLNYLYAGINNANGKSIDVAVPPGTENEQKLRLKGQGLPGMGGMPAGDAIIEVHVEPHPFFTRQDDDIHVEVPITLGEAVLGATIHVPTISGKVALKVTPGTNTGAVLRLRGKGVVNQTTKQAGDQYVKLKVVLPDPPDAELVKFIEQWSKTRSYDVRKKAGLE